MRRRHIHYSNKTLRHKHRRDVQEQKEREAQYQYIRNVVKRLQGVV
jgi:hypothetical protein